MIKVSDRDNRKGAGVYLEDGSWFYLPWTGIIKDTRMGRNLSLLEGLAALFGGIVATVRYPGRWWYGKTTWDLSTYTSPARAVAGFVVRWQKLSWMWEGTLEAM